MLHKIRPFDKRKDMEEVDQFGWLNLTDAYAHGVIPADLRATEGEFAPVENAEAMIGRPADEFDAIRMVKFIKERGVVEKTKEAPKGAE